MSCVLNLFLAAILSSIFPLKARGKYILLKLLLISGYYIYFYLNVLNCVYTPVKLCSSTEDVCPGGTVVFTCVTNTGKLIWSVGNGISQSFHSPAQLNMPIHDDIFTLLLQNVTGDIY